jgi:hypothetical protein
MRHMTATAAAALAVIATQVLLAQPPMNPTVPGAPGDPVWQGILRLEDGRTFVTDGGLALDAGIAKPVTLPGREVSPKLLEDYFKATHKHKDECGLSDLRAAASGKTYSTPNGIALSATYINYLRRILPADSVRLRMTGPLQPVVIVASRKAVGVLMPVMQ